MIVRIDVKKPVILFGQLSACSLERFEKTFFSVHFLFRFVGFLFFSLGVKNNFSLFPFLNLLLFVALLKNKHAMKPSRNVKKGHAYLEQYWRHHQHEIEQVFVKAARILVAVHRML